MKGLDLSKFKKHSSDKHSTTLVHPDGHEIRIAHGSLKGDLKKQLDSLPHYAEGGDVESAPAMEQAPMSKEPSFIDRLANAKVGGDSGGLGESSDWSAAFPSLGEFKPPQPEMSMQQPGTENVPGLKAAPAQQVDPSLFRNAQPIQEGMKQTAEAMQQEANVKGALGNVQGEILHKQQQEQAAQLKLFQDKVAANEQMIQSTIKDIKDGHIDPQHYINSQSAPAQISTAIGLILGGMGGGAAGTGNPALDFLNKQIDRDVEAQRANMNNKHNLMSALNQQFGNIRDAATMTKAIYAEMYANKLQEAANYANSPMAHANAERAIGELKLKYGPELQAMNIRQAVLQGQGSGIVKPEQAVTALVPESHQAKAFEEIKDYQIKKNAIEDISKTLHDAEKLQTLEKRVGSPFQSKSQLDAVNLKIGTLAKEMFGKVSDTEIHQLKGAEIKMSDDAATVRKKIQTLQEIALKTGAYPTLTGYGVQLPKLQTGSGFTPRK